MSDTSNASKQRWNALNYTQVKISVRPELAAAFKSACAEAGASMASVLAGFMASYSQFPAKRDPLVDPYATRKQRRRAVEALISQMDSLALAEESYRDNIPETCEARYVTTMLIGTLTSHTRPLIGCAKSIEGKAVNATGVSATLTGEDVDNAVVWKMSKTSGGGGLQHLPHPLENPL